MHNPYSWDAALHLAKAAVLKNQEQDRNEPYIYHSDLSLSTSNILAATKDVPSLHSSRNELPVRFRYLALGENHRIDGHFTREVKPTNFGGIIQDDHLVNMHSHHAPQIDKEQFDASQHMNSLPTTTSMCQSTQAPDAKAQQATNRTLSLDTGITQETIQNLDSPTNFTTSNTSISRCPSLTCTSTSPTLSARTTTSVFSDFTAFNFDFPTPSQERTNTPNTTTTRTTTPENSSIPHPHPSIPQAQNPHTEFIPSAILRGERRSPTPSLISQASSIKHPINPNYKGEFTSFDLRNALCTEDENCALRIHNIPSLATLAEIFEIITHGKVLSFHRNAPVRGVHPYAAARLVFLTRAAAEAFMADAHSGVGLRIRGQRVEVRWNRDRVSPAEARYEKMSRVIRIKGPAEEISIDMLESFFRQKFAFQLVSSKEWIERAGHKIVELGFSSIRAQSESAMKSFRQYIMQNMPDGGYNIWYTHDPCGSERSNSTGNGLRDMRSWR